MKKIIIFCILWATSAALTLELNLFDENLMSVEYIVDFSLPLGILCSPDSYKSIIKVQRQRISTDNNTWKLNCKHHKNSMR